MNLNEILTKAIQLTDCITKVYGKELDSYTLRVDNQQVVITAADITVTLKLPK